MGGITQINMASGGKDLFVKVKFHVVAAVYAIMETLHIY